MRPKSRTKANCACALAAATAFAIIANAASAQSAFVKVGPEVSYDAGDRCGVPHWAVADLNGDGRPDFVLANATWSSFTSNPVPAPFVMIWIAQPDGSYREQTSQMFSGPVPLAFGGDPLVADFNGDGRPDIYLPDQGQDAGFAAQGILGLSTSAGYVDASARFAGISPRKGSSVFADIDGNGTLDIFESGFGNPGTSIGLANPNARAYLLVNDGIGNFTYTQSPLPRVLLAFAPEQGARSKQIDATTWYVADERFGAQALIDVNRDGYPDLVLAGNAHQPNGQVFLNDGHGDFSKLPPIDLPPGVNGGNWQVAKKDSNGNWIYPWVDGPGESTQSVEIRAVDLNGDGYPDLIIQEHKCLLKPKLTCYYGGYLQILINQGGHGFVDETAARGSPGFDSPDAQNNYQMTLQIADVNGDGFPDLIATKLWPYEPHVYLNDGTGRFSRTTLPGLPFPATDSLYIVVSGGFQQPTRIANVRFDWRYDTPTTGINQCTLRVQTWERPAPIPAATNYQGLWWAAPANSESGWGINLAHQGDTIFATWFTYDNAGKAWWVSMTADKSADKTYSGSVVQTAGPAFSAAPFDPAKVTRTTVGNGTLKFTDGDNGSFTYTVNGATQTKPITKQIFGAAPTCHYGALPGLLALATNYQDLWWASPAASESGWGVNLTHQGDNIFATWFTYDADGTPLWLSATAARKPLGTYDGTLYRTTGPSFSADPFNSAMVKRSAVGDASFKFWHGNAATMSYTVNGVAQSKLITRQLFASAGTYCQ